MREVTTRGLEFLKREEGLMLLPYKDAAGLWAIGIGHTLTKSELSSGKLQVGDKELKWCEGLNEPQATTLLAQDLDRVEASLTYDPSTGRLEDHEYDALASLCFNIGVGSYRNSTLRKLLVAGRKEEAADQFLRWKHAAGKVVSGLLKRRERERILFLEGNYGA